MAKAKAKPVKPDSSSAASDDESMQDAVHEDAPEDMVDETEKVEEEAEKVEEEAEMEDDEQELQEIDDGKHIKILPGSTPTAASFEFTEEGHTLGNALRYVIMKNPEVEFCAYTIPHPAEAKMNVRIQTYEGTTSVEALTKGLRDLQDLCDVVSEKFWEARNTVPKIPAPSKKQLDENGVPLPANA